jgi:hypothetical protein
MSIKVSINQRPSTQVTIKPQKVAVSSVNFGTRPSLKLGQLLDVDASDADNLEALVYDAETNKYIVKPIIVDSNNIINVAGGTF